MAALIPFRRAVFIPKLSLQEFVFGTDAVSYPFDSMVLYVFFPVSEAQVNL